MKRLFSLPTLCLKEGKSEIILKWVEAFKGLAFWSACPSATNEEHLLMLLIVRCPQSVSKSLCYRWVRRLKGGISFIHFAIEREKERIQELSVHFRQTLEVRWWSQLSFERRAELRQKELEWKFLLGKILKGPTDLWDKINGDQTLLNFSFNGTLQDGSSEKSSV